MRQHSGYPEASGDNLLDVVTDGTGAAPTTLYERVGGDEYFHALVDRFYEGVEADPVLRPLYPDDLGPTWRSSSSSTGEVPVATASGAGTHACGCVTRFPSARRSETPGSAT
jgi:hypothetical protein